MWFRNLAAAWVICAGHLTAFAQIQDPLAASQMLHQDIWVTQSGEKLKAPDFENRWLLVTLAYTECESACPMIVHQLKDLRKKLSAEQKTSLHFILLSLKPEADSPPAMKKFMKHHGLKSSDWTFIRGTEEQARLMASHLDMSFGPLKGASRHIMHSSKVALISPDGKLRKVWLSSEFTSAKLQESLATP
jgi:cytochrome oxidase Cu insertion factor (SCO1/SenC/PrrC family)